MSDFWLYLQLGFNHVLDWNGYDHLLFLVVLVSVYEFTDWKKVVGLVTTFTLGHMISLVAATFGWVTVSPTAVEFLIPVTILATAIYHLLKTRKTGAELSIYGTYFMTLFFGLIHGLGFASFFRSLDESAALPLFEFALGIELAQLLIVLIALVVGFVSKNILKTSSRDWTIAICCITIGMLVTMLAETWPF
ncbi:HupE/UreJ family protein [Gilvibacter sp.]|uniref:HupE/UreJ family protein n=1 Tax=Gilvibacter sp. TaxID=2729997 RepID=UPI003B527344